MTDCEYINATNLAKIRAAKNILHDTLPDAGQHDTLCETAMAALRVWESELERVVNPAHQERP